MIHTNMKNKSIKLFCCALSCCLLAFVACDTEWDEHTEIKDKTRGESLMKALSAHPEFSTFASILEKTGYRELLEGNKMLTVFAPVNDALEGAVDLNDVAALKELVRNHIAYANYTLVKGSFETAQIEMINSKYVPVKGAEVNGVQLMVHSGNVNISAANGILHQIEGVIPTQKNIWEYLKTQSGNLQVDFILREDKEVMDPDKSIQIGVTPNGNPVYDTIWMNTNPLLESYPLNVETEKFTYALLPNEVIRRIETKYAKYFVRNDQAEQDSIVRLELIKDCILAPVSISADGSYLSLDGVKVDISVSQIQETYQASNGIVYTLNDAEVKLYENKIRTVFIEGEEYVSNYTDNPVAWFRRSRSGASGGKDMMLNQNTRFISRFMTMVEDTLSPGNWIEQPDSVTYTFNYSANVISKVNNCYLEYKPVLHSTAYKMYWVTHDDIPAHYADTSLLEPYKFSQKLLISFPEQPAVYRGSDGLIHNHFSETSVFTSGRSTAGIREEKPLQRALLNPAVANEGLFLLSRNWSHTGEEDYFNYYTGNDASGDRETLLSPNYGEATLMVANTTEYTGVNAGMIFLDYIKLVPVVDVND